MGSDLRACEIVVSSLTGCGFCGFPAANVPVWMGQDAGAVEGVVRAEVDGPAGDGAAVGGFGGWA